MNCITVLHGYQLFEPSHHYKHFYVELAVVHYVGFPFLPFSRLLPCLTWGCDCKLGSVLLDNPSGAVLRLFSGRPSLFSDGGNFLFPPAFS